MLNLNRSRNAEQYMKNQVTTASDGQLIIMLYDGAIRFLGKAIKAIDEKNMEESHNMITKSRKIVLELMFSLDMEKGGDISKNLYDLYFFMNQQLIKANIEKNIDIIKECTELLRDLRITWKEVIEINKVKNAKQIPGSEIKI